MSFLYCILFIISVIMIPLYKFKVKNTTLPMLMLYIIFAIINLGYFILSISKSLSIAILGNRLAYFGSAFLLFDLIIIFYDILYIKLKKWAKNLLGVISTLAFLLAASGGSSIKLFYKEVALERSDDYSFLVKEYGTLHILYKIYILLYFLIILAGILMCIIKNNKSRIKEAYLLLILTLSTFVFWIIEASLNIQFELIAIIYVIGGLILIFIYSLIEELISNQTTTPVFFKDEEIDKIIEETKVELTEREKEILRRLLRNQKRKDIAEELFVTEDTVKKHTSHIFKKFGVANRNELFAIIQDK